MSEPILNRTEQAWHRVVVSLVNHLPEPVTQRRAALDDLIAIVPPSHPDAQVLARMAYHMDEAALLQREFNFESQSTHQKG